MSDIVINLLPFPYMPCHVQQLTIFVQGYVFASVFYFHFFMKINCLSNNLHQHHVISLFLFKKCTRALKYRCILRYFSEHVNVHLQFLHSLIASKKQWLLLMEVVQFEYWCHSLKKSINTLKSFQRCSGHKINFDNTKAKYLGKFHWWILT